MGRHGGRPYHDKNERRRKCPRALQRTTEPMFLTQVTSSDSEKRRDQKRYDSCNITGTLSPGFSRGRPLVLTTTFPHSPEAGKPPIWRG